MRLFKGNKAIPMILGFVSCLVLQFQGSERVGHCMEQGQDRHASLT